MNKQPQIKVDIKDWKLQTTKFNGSSQIKVDIKDWDLSNIPNITKILTQK